jgi:hypothetical protein
MTTITRENLYSKGTIISPNGNFEWEGHSDGNEGTLKVTIDGKDTQIIHFTKDQLEDLFNQSVMKMQLDKRLMMDFMSDDDTYVNPFKNVISSNKNKNTRRKNKKNNKKSRKNK